MFKVKHVSHKLKTAAIVETLKRRFNETFQIYIIMSILIFNVYFKLPTTLPLLLCYRRTEDINVVKFTFASFGLDSFKFNLPLCTVSLKRE